MEYLDDEKVLVTTFRKENLNFYEGLYDNSRLPRHLYSFRKTDETYYELILDIKKLYEVVKNKEEMYNRRDLINTFIHSCTDITQKNNKLDLKKLDVLPSEYNCSKDKKSYWCFNFLNDKSKDLIYKYQLENIEWMAQTEESKNDIIVNNNRYFNVYNDLYFDRTDNIFVFRESPEYINKNIKGGFLSDDMGLGKTLSILSLIECLKNKNKKTKPSIIFTDNQLCSQWEKECVKFTDLSCLTISSKRDFEKVKYKDILSTDVVIVSYDFLKNKIFSERISQYEQKKSCDEYYVEQILKMKAEINPKEEDRNIPFNIVEWERVILDEFHSAYNFYSYIFSLDTKFRWMLSGTPFENCYENTKRSLSLLLEDFKNKDETCSVIVNKTDKNIYIRRNTKESVKEELRMPQIVKQIEYLTFSDTERTLYNTLKLSRDGYSSWFYEEELRRICCFPNFSRQLNSVIKSFSDISEIKKALIDNNNKEINNLRKELEFEQRQLEYSRSMLVDYTEEVIINRTNRDIKIIEDHIQTLQKKIDNSSRRSNFLYNTEISKNFRCPFCFDDKDDPVITICGHTYCEECCYQMVASLGSCGICRHVLSKSDIIKVITPDLETDENILKYGTKISSIIKYIKERSSEKIIIFSEWDEMLMKLKNILKEQCITTLSCRGSIYQKNKSIKTFTDGQEGCVILLSSSNSANGINLTCSNNIIFLEPSINSKDLEKQATARTNRIGQTKDTFIKYFIMKDTIEEEIMARDL
jgi:SNF2 family DNA or RNA helicase